MEWTREDEFVALVEEAASQLLRGDASEISAATDAGHAGETAPALQAQHAGGEAR